MSQNDYLRDVYFCIPSFGMYKPEFLCRISVSDLDEKKLDVKKRKDGIVYSVCAVGEMP